MQITGQPGVVMRYQASWGSCGCRGVRAVGAASVSVEGFDVGLSAEEVIGQGFPLPVGVGES